jgi:hypothetical protein
MVKWEAFTHEMENGTHAVMIRNHKTSYALCTFTDARLARAQAVKINRYHFSRKVELYRQAMKAGILGLKHEELAMHSTKLKRVSIEKGTECYALLVFIGGRQYIVKKEKLKKDIESWYRMQRMQFTEEEFIEQCKLRVERKSVR